MEVMRFFVWAEPGLSSDFVPRVQAWAKRAGVRLEVRVVPKGVVLNVRNADREEAAVLYRLVRRAGNRIGIFIG